VITSDEQQRILK